MVNTAEQFKAVWVQYSEDWAQYVARIEARLRALQIAKQGMELFLLVGSYLILYFIECFTEVLAMPLPLVR